MASCQNSCKLCNNLIISDNVSIVGENLVIDIPAGSYANGDTYCIVVAQAIPAGATVNQPVYISIGGVTTTIYPLADKCGVQITASEIRTRTRYKTVVVTSPTTGVFRLCYRLCNRSANNLAALPAPAVG